MRVWCASRKFVDPTANWRTSTSGYVCLCNIQNMMLTMISQVDREKVLKEGQSIAGKLLLELQVRRSTADGPGARKFYTELTTPLPGWLGEIRDVVLKMKQPRKMMLQPNTFVVDGEVVLKEYPLTAGGMIESLIERNL
ncbi:hypothetical protein M404DRAFT_629854 [Pisolithus tinctorius Marx 270]|uniref:Uncharacterized protein n=1 Tax=Pisolithus tinctorius Marx 270 TaxID=870435 RepID=A0A0C3J1N8_PISTI|nr:hypothetical protein M404DRAFT_629854 [Pisolithus tinctorius Marx 270]